MYLIFLLFKFIKANKGHWQPLPIVATSLSAKKALGEAATTLVGR